jgi:hypothetical protein
VHVNGIISKLEEPDRGCFMTGKYVGILMYADELLLRSTTFTDLRRMIAICELEIKWLEMRFNVNKSCFLRFGRRYKHTCDDVISDRQPLTACDSMKYVGVECKIKLCLVQKRLKFFRAVNFIYAAFGATESPMVSVHLLKSFCLPINSLWFGGSTCY